MMADGVDLTTLLLSDRCENNELLPSFKLSEPRFLLFVGSTRTVHGALQEDKPAVKS
jgi:hypothetical protein